MELHINILVVVLFSIIADFELDVAPDFDGDVEAMLSTAICDPNSAFRKRISELRLTTKETINLQKGEFLDVWRSDVGDGSFAPDQTSKGFKKLKASQPHLSSKEVILRCRQEGGSIQPTLSMGSPSRMNTLQDMLCAESVARRTAEDTLGVTLDHVKRLAEELQQLKQVRAVHHTYWRKSSGALAL